MSMIDEVDMMRYSVAVDESIVLYAACSLV